MKLSSVLTVFGLLTTLATHAAAPPNDNFANRIVMVGSSLTVTGFNTGASREPGETRLFGTGANASTGTQTVWWTWVATKDVSVKMTTLGSVQTLDTTLGVYTGTNVSTLTTIASNDDISGNNSKSSLFFNATNGVNYHFQVDGFVPNDVGKVFLNLHESNTPPSVLITNIASGNAFSAGSSISIFAFASDYGTVTNVEFYQDSTRLGQDTTSPYSVTWSSLPQGSFALTAVAKNNSGLSTTSGPCCPSPPPQSSSFLRAHSTKRD